MAALLSGESPAKKMKPMDAESSDAEEPAAEDDMRKILAIKDNEVVPVHDFYKDGGAFCKQPGDMNAEEQALFHEEFCKLLEGKDSAFYFGLQPMYKRRQAKKKGKWRCVGKELLVRAKDGKQCAPSAVIYWQTAQERMSSFFYQICLAKQVADEEDIYVSVNCWVQDLEKEKVRDLIVGMTVMRFYYHQGACTHRGACADACTSSNRLQRHGQMQTSGCQPYQTKGFVSEKWSLMIS